MIFRTPKFIKTWLPAAAAAAVVLLSGSYGLAQDLEGLHMPDTFDDDMISVVTDRPLEVASVPKNSVPKKMYHRNFTGAYSEPESYDTTITEVDSTQVEIFRERYTNGKVKIEREVALDSEGNYVNHGSWKMWDQAGVLIADGQYDMGLRVGSWTRVLGRNQTDLLRQSPFNRFKAPFVSQATFDNDKMNGEWLIIDADQRKCSQISLEKGIRNGLAITWMTNGKILRQTQYDHGVPVGEVLQTEPSSGETKQVATFLDGRRVAKNTAKHGRSQQKKSEEMYLAPKTVQTTADVFWATNFAKYGTEGESLRHGISRAWYTNGQPEWTGEYRYDKRIGQFQYWHANGQLAATGHYQNDAYTGQWIWWHENGQKAIVGEYRDGQLVGEWRWWNELGKLANRKLYDGTEVYTSQEPADAETDSDRIGQMPSLQLNR